MVRRLRSCATSWPRKTPTTTGPKMKRWLRERLKWKQGSRRSCGAPERKQRSLTMKEAALSACKSANATSRRQAVLHPILGRVAQHGAGVLDVHEIVAVVRLAEEHVE